MPGRVISHDDRGASGERFEHDMPEILAKGREDEQVEATEKTYGPVGWNRSDILDYLRIANIIDQLEAFGPVPSIFDWACYGKAGLAFHERHRPDYCCDILLRHYARVEDQGAIMWIRAGPLIVVLSLAIDGDVSSKVNCNMTPCACAEYAFDVCLLLGRGSMPGNSPVQSERAERSDEDTLLPPLQCKGAGRKFSARG